MSENTNTLFWVITGAVIVLASFLLIQNNTLSNINDTFATLFTNAQEGNNEVPEEPEEPEEPAINYDDYIPATWTVMDIVATDGVIYIAGNPNNLSSGGCQFDARIINTNDYDVHIINSNVTFVNSDTEEVIISIDLPFDRVLSKDAVIITGASVGQPIGTTNHYVEFTPWRDL